MTKTILYIEDDAASRTLVERTLIFAGYTVHLAERGLEGVDLARSIHPDMVLTDVNLPDISGREVTTMLRSESYFRHIPIVALTAQALDEQREMTMASGISGYIVKPIDVEALPGQIEHYLSGAKDHLDTGKLVDAQERYTQEVVTRLEARIRELETVNDNLRRLDKMKDSFIQLTAHELRTPLTLVNGYCRLLQDNPALKSAIQQNDAARTLVSGLGDSIERMQGVINEIVTVSRIMTNQIEMSISQLVPATIVRKVLANHEATLQGRHLHLHFDPTNWPTKMYADAELLALALSNLIGNAIKYTPDNGSIHIRARADQREIRLIVEDTGIGVAKEEQQRIFDRFHSAHDPLLHSTSKTAFQGGGLGLGLAVAKAVAEAHNGRIWVESTGCDPAKLPGSTFIMAFPLTAEPVNRTGSLS